MKRIKSFAEFITEELQKITSDASISGKTKYIDWIWDEPSNDQSASAGVLLRNKLKEEEFQDIINTLSDIKFDELPDISKKSFRKERDHNRLEKLKITLNNLRFLKDMKKERGELRCEYCNKGPLIIYDFTESDLLGTGKRFNTKFKPTNGATCDHKTPISRGGDKFDYDNLAVCCYKCNQRKRNMSYEDWLDLLQVEAY